jgi:hypothetical protein
VVVVVVVVAILEFDPHPMYAELRESKRMVTTSEGIRTVGTERMN